MAAQNFKVVVLGSGGVGKSALTIRLVTDNFLEEYDPTIEDSYRKNVVVDESPCVLDILDTAGQDEYASMQDQWIREGNGFLIVYSITDQASFQIISTFKEKINRAHGKKKMPMVLVGNKCDMENQRQVSFDTGKQLALEWGCPFIETSAKSRIRNVECFHQVVREIRATDKSSSQKVAAKKSWCTIL